MTTTKVRRGTLTKDDLLAAANLKRIWNLKKVELALTQESAGHLLGMNQSAASQYLNSRIPLGAIHQEVAIPQDHKAR